MATQLTTSWQKLNSYTVEISGFTGEFQLWGKYSTQDVTNNRTKVHYSWDLEIEYGYARSYDAEDYLTGAGWNGAAYRQYTSSGNLRSWEEWNNHASDGTGGGSFTGRTRMGGIGVDTGWVSADYTLPTIPRASVPTASPNPRMIWQGGAPLTIYTNRKSSAFTHTVTLSYGTWSETRTGVTTSTEIEIPYAVGAQFASTSKTATATITCITYSGTTAIGTKTGTVTLQINAEQDHANIGTITTTDINTQTSAIINAGQAVYGQSIIQATIPLTVSGSYTELASAKVVCGSSTQTYTLSGTSQTIIFTKGAVDVSSLTVTVTDKRGNSVSKTAQWELLPYQPITLTASVGRVSATGSTATGQVTGTAYGGTYGSTANSLTITYEYKLHSASEYTAGQDTYTQSISAGQQNYNHAMTFAESFDYQNQYDIRFAVSDLFSTATYTAQLMQGLPIVSWDETEVDVWGDLHIHSRENPYVYQDVMAGFDAVLAHNGQKNLLANTGATVTRNGITYTNNGDGTWTVNGTATADSYGVIADGYEQLSFDYPVTLSGCPEGGNGDTYWLQFYLYDGTNTARDYGDGVTVTPSGTGSRNVAIYIHAGTTVNNLVFKPMLRDARIASDTFVQPAIQTAMVNITGKSSRAQLFKFGKVVFFTSPSDGTYSNGLNNIGTIPTGYRPAAEVRLPVSNDARNTRFVIIQTTGSIQHYANNSATSNSNYALTACWLTLE